MATADETLGALNEIHGQEKPDDIGLGEWIWGALRGDFNPERSAGQIGFDMVFSLIPVVDTLCDFRDLCANIRQFRKDPDSRITLFIIATTIVGFIPEIGTVAKSVLRIVWVYLKPLVRHADDITNASKLTAAAGRACESALPKITEYLQHNHVAKWATDGKLPDIYQFIAKTIRETSDRLNPGLLSRHLDEKLNDLTSLLQKIRLVVPGLSCQRIDDLLHFLDAKGRSISGAVQGFARPVRIVLKIVAKQLDDHAWHVEIYRTNRGWIAPISSSGSARLINAKPPKWVERVISPIEFPALVLSNDEVKDLMRKFPHHPSLERALVKTFSRKGGGIRADTIVGPAKLYRIVDPSNDGAGIFWMSETEFKSIRNRDDWRSRYAVKPEWNQNGWVVEYEVKAGEILPVWRGPAASQELDETNYYLKGGAEQIVFFPGSRDEMIQAIPRVDRETGGSLQDSMGNIDRRIEYIDVTGKMVPTKLRSRITDPHIKGPFDTGWGATDYTPQEASRILLNVPN